MFSKAVCCWCIKMSICGVKGYLDVKIRTGSSSNFAGDKVSLTKNLEVFIQGRKILGEKGILFFNVLKCHLSQVFYMLS